MTGERNNWGAIPPVFAIAAAVRLLAVMSFPLSFWVADGKNYMHMLIRGESNLIHSPGYPFLMGLPWRNPIGHWLVVESPSAFHYSLNLSQHLVCIAAAYLGFRVMREVFGSSAANIFAVLYLLDYRSIFVTSTVTPEWLQASLVVVLTCTVYWAFERSKLEHKVLLYTLAGLIASATYLVKFNSIFLFVFPGMIALADLRRSIRVGVALGAGVLAFAVFYGAFLVGYHRPSTGTYIISFDHAWVLMEKARMFVPNRELRPETGINTKRLLVLNGVLPSVEHRGPIGHVDFVADDIRAPYREKYLGLFHADHDVLDSYLADLEIPRPFDFSKAFLPSAYFLDLPESNRLGIAVFKEQVIAYKWRFLSDVVVRSLRQFVDPNTGLHPSNQMEFRRGEVKPVGWGFVRLTLPVHEMRDRCFWYDHPVIWKPGAYVFRALSWLQEYPASWVSILIGFGCWYAMAQWRRIGRLSPWIFAQLGLALTCVIFLFASNAVYHFRWKELHTIVPLLTALAGVSVTELFGVIRRSECNPGSR